MRKFRKGWLLWSIVCTMLLLEEWDIDFLRYVVDHL